MEEKWGGRGRGGRGTIYIEGFRCCVLRMKKTHLASYFQGSPERIQKKEHGHTLE